MLNFNCLNTILLDYWSFSVEYFTVISQLPIKISLVMIILSERYELIRENQTSTVLGI